MSDTTVIVTDEFEEWYGALDDDSQGAVDREVKYLEMLGVLLEHPHSSDIVTSKYGLRELRATFKKKELRVFYAFDPARNAVLLLGGDKAGDRKFYEKNVKKADKIWEDYLQETKQC